VTNPKLPSRRRCFEPSFLARRSARNDPPGPVFLPRIAVAASPGAVPWQRNTRNEASPDRQLTPLAAPTEGRRRPAKGLDRGHRARWIQAMPRQKNLEKSRSVKQRPLGRDSTAHAPGSEACHGEISPG